MPHITQRHLDVCMMHQCTLKQHAGAEDHMAQALSPTRMKAGEIFTLHFMTLFLDIAYLWVSQVKGQIQ